MSFEFDNNIPIYIQLVEQLKIKIISGEIGSGERLPSVRDLSMENKVNPNTMQRALSELEEMGLIYTERTNGKFITRDETIILKHKKEYADIFVNSFLGSMEKIGYTLDETINYLEGNK